MTESFEELEDLKPIVEEAASFAKQTSKISPFNKHESSGSVCSEQFK